jgi:hypothetical protein
MVGEVSTFASCTVSASALTVVTDSPLPFKQLQVAVAGLTNFDQGNSQPFVLTTSYDGQQLQTTGTATGSTSATTTAQASPLKVSTILLDPSNEGESATYEFFFSPVLPISVDMYIVVRFPKEFDIRVGDAISCWATGLSGYISCFWLHARMIAVTKFDAFNCSGCEIELSIAGVLNPGIGQTGQFGLGVLKGSTYTELNENAGKVTLTAAPHHVDVLHTYFSNSFSRYTQTISVNFSTPDAIPSASSGGSIWLRFSSSYLLTGSLLSCESSAVWGAGVPACYINGSTVVLSAPTAGFLGNLLVAVDGVPNPLLSGLAGPVGVAVYDGFNRQLLGRSYEGLDPSQHGYSYAGPLITVNNNQRFVVRRGTLSAFVPVTLDFPCALNLTLVPQSPPFSFFPAQISFSVGQFQAQFRLSVPANTEDTDYVILWSILGENTPPFYTPVQKSQFTVVKETRLQVLVEDIMPVPRGAQSLPVVVTLEAAPAADLTVHLALPGDVPGVELSNSSLLFTSGVFSLSFTLTVAASAATNSSTVSFAISGTNTEAYSLASLSKPFSIFNDSGGPQILGAGIVRTLRTSALATLTANKFCWCYYAVALAGTQPPSFQETKNQGPASYPTTQTMYGVVRVAISTTQLFNMSGLSAGGRYSLFLWAEDLSGTSSTTFAQLDFDTDPGYLTATLGLTFQQVYLNDVEILHTSQVLQLFLSLSSWRLQLATSETVQISANAEYSKTTPSPHVTYYVIDDYESSAYPPPIQIIARLDTLINSFTAMLNNFDSSLGVDRAEIVLQDCAFQVWPQVDETSSTYQSIKLNGVLEEDGYIFAIALLADNDPGTPFAFQVMMGNDKWNRPALRSFTNASAGEIAEVEFTNVQYNTSYNIYVICTNNYPGHLGMMKDSQVGVIGWTTQDHPAPMPFSLDFAFVVIPIVIGYLF